MGLLPIGFNEVFFIDDGTGSDVIRQFNNHIAGHEIQVVAESTDVRRGTGGHGSQTRFIGHSSTEFQGIVPHVLRQCRISHDLIGNAAGLVPEDPELDRHTFFLGSCLSRGSRDAGGECG